MTIPKQFASIGLAALVGCSGGSVEERREVGGTVVTRTHTEYHDITGVHIQRDEYSFRLGRSQYECAWENGELYVHVSPVAGTLDEATQTCERYRRMTDEALGI